MLPGRNIATLYYQDLVLPLYTLNRAFIVSLAVGNTVRVFKLGKKDDGTPASITPVLDFPLVCLTCLMLLERK